MTTWPAASMPCTWNTDFAISRPIVATELTFFMLAPPNHGAHQRRPSSWRLRAGEEPFHSINSGLLHCKSISRGHRGLLAERVRNALHSVAFPVHSGTPALRIASKKSLLSFARLNGIRGRS